ncbi:MAG: seg [Parcubacteria group bacterium]|nr:seg [Parcubacteria group bacterium]
MKKTSNRGFTLFIAVVITATLMLVSMGIISVAVREAFLTSSARESQYAFYAADTGAECALFWDVKNGSGESAFSTSTQTTIFCNEDSANSPNPSGGTNVVGGSSISNFTLTFFPDPYCAKVIVTKADNGATTIQSRGYNTCDPANPRRVERAVQVNY